MKISKKSMNFNIGISFNFRKAIENVYTSYKHSLTTKKKRLQATEKWQLQLLHFNRVHPLKNAITFEIANQIQCLKELQLSLSAIRWLRHFAFYSLF